MDTISINDLKNFEIDIDFFSLIISIITSTICAYIIKFIYLKFGKSINNKENFSDTFVLLAITTTVVITVVKFSLALSLGLVGALSIVRFRAAIKEPEELIYLFLIIGIGLASGSGQHYISFVLTAVSYVVIYFDNRFRKKTFGIAAEILSIEINQNDYEKLQIKLKEFIDGSNIQLDLKSITNVNSRLEIIYSIKNETNIDNLNKFIDKFNNIGLENLNYSISKDVHLPL